MKHYLTLIALIIVLPGLYAQTNTFPTSGNVGIGTLSPNFKLDVVGRMQLQPFGSGSAGTWYTDNAGTAIGFFGLNGSTSSSSLGFYHGGLWRLLVTPVGNVGIGTQTPNSKLDIKGTGTSTGSALRITDNADVERMKVLDNGTTTFEGLLNVNTHTWKTGNYTTLKIDQYGNVEIPTAYAKLRNLTAHNNSVGWVTSLAAGTGVSTGWTLKHLGSVDDNLDYSLLKMEGVLTESNGVSHTYSNLSIKPTYNITGGNRVMIGIEYDPTLTAMSGVTHIAANLAKGQLRLGEINNDDALTQILARDPGTGEIKYRAASSLAGESSIWASSGANAFFDTGNIGIGIDNPQNKLDVNGTIHAKEVKVDLTGWPDYVFEADYQLMTMSELVDYIKANKHLPGVPSAREVEKNGLMLGEMNKLLMQKMEEMTLYMIEMKRELEQQRAEIESLKSEK